MESKIPFENLAGRFLASGEKIPYKFAGREQRDQANLRRPQAASSSLKKVAAATFLKRLKRLRPLFAFGAALITGGLNG